MVRGKHDKGLLGPVRGDMPQDVVDTLTWETVPAKVTTLFPFSFSFFPFLIFFFFFFYILQPTTVIFFDSFVPHRSEPNRTQKDRRVCLSTYAKASEADFYPRKTYFDDKVKTAPPDVYKDDGVAYRGYLI